MHQFIKEFEIPIRLSFFFGIFLVMALWEILAPKRVLQQSKSKRWLNNAAIVVIDSLLVRVLFPTAVVGMALIAQQQEWGILNNVPLNYWLKVVIAVFVLDFVIYLQHVLFHRLPNLWRIHRMHHLDLDFDVTTGLRFHPVEIFISLAIKFSAVMLLGPPLLGVLIFEILLNGTTMFNHANIRMPFLVDKLIRMLIVTPDMHRVHHSTLWSETNSNFGFNFSIWDRIFGTYKAQPKLGHIDMEIGVRDIREKKYCINLLGMLWSPLVNGITRKNKI